MPPVTARDSGKGAFYAPRPCYKVETTTFAITLKESEKTPKYRNYMKRENLNLVCPAKCHPLQLETPERARCTPLGVDLKAMATKVKRTLLITLKESEKTPKYRKLHEKGKPKSCMSCQMPPVTVRDSGKGALYAPRCGLESLELRKGAFYAPRPCYKSETEHFCDNFKGIRENSEIPKLLKRENLNLVCPAKCHPLQLETPERARCTPLGVDLKVYNQL
ncbi:hypothetical protein Fcan01_28620 [Folsomia candida]|uniref:Uncharacterized protein n=1 Tax=Folsomia candida TaxID=158441 RepID=A0A226CUG8_FOLCA|nr:hypothetical protein Fcan01_28620 [Folsomia candida]